MFSLEKSPQFQSEYKSFKEKIDQIEDTKSKQELESMLNSLQTKVKLLDVQHNEFGFDNRLPPIVLDTRDSIIQIRKMINLKLKSLDLL